MGYIVRMSSFTEGPVVVVGTDGSDTATEAVRRAADIVRSRGGRLHVVTAVDGLPRSSIDPYIPDELRAVVESPGLRADSILKEAANGVAKGLDVATHVERGGVVDVLNRVADAVVADVIVVGNQRPAMMPKFIAGSISDRVARHARCDVLVVNTDRAAA